MSGRRCARSVGARYRRLGIRLVGSRRVVLRTLPELTAAKHSGGHSAAPASGPGTSASIRAPVSLDSGTVGFPDHLVDIRATLLDDLHV